MSLEEALESTQSDTDAAIEVTKRLLSSLRKLHAATHSGMLREIPKAIEAMEQTLTRLREAVSTVRDGWNFNEVEYFSNKTYTRELLKAARKAGVQLHEQDDRLYCYPSLIRIVPGDAVVIIDQRKEKRLRPMVLVEQLRALQQQPVKFRSEAFIESLSDAYDYTLGKRGRGAGALVPLVEIYKLLTLLPGQRKEYSKHEFARDLYLLDESGVRKTQQGTVVQLHYPAGREPDSRIFSTVSKDGTFLRYHGISFS